MVRQGPYKYIPFRNAPPLAFDVKADPGEQHNLLAREQDVPALVRQLEQFAHESMDFDAAEKERVERDGNLNEQYAQDVPPSTGNLYVMPSGQVINADDPLYHPTVISESIEHIAEADVILHG